MLTVPPLLPLITTPSGWLTPPTVPLTFRVPVVPMLITAVAVETFGVAFRPGMVWVVLPMSSLAVVVPVVAAVPTVTVLLGDSVLLALVARVPATTVVAPK